MKRLIIIPLVLGLAALGVALSKPDPEKESPHYTLHEWGTFTSVFGSDGRMLAGLEREEEALPPFVHAHAGMRSKPGLKAMTRPVHNVTVKMETPVIYFYSDEGFKAHVDVGFHGGSISQWYPNRSSGEVPPTFKADNFQSTAIDFAKGYEGSIAWNIEVLERSAENDSKPFVGTESTSWLYPRMTDANVVKNAEGEHEKYLFYRGLGNFEQPIRPVFVSNGSVRVENTGDDPIPYAMLFDSTNEGVLMKEIGAIPANGAQEVTFDEQDRVPHAMAFHPGLLGVPEFGGPKPSWQPKVYQTMVQALVDQGLYQREADSMVRTWWRSYFEHRGCRIFWIVPDAFVEKVLPLEVTPAPTHSKRVLVGRSELLKPGFERELLSKGEKLAESYGTDRFFGPYQERVHQLTQVSMSAKVPR